MPEPTDIATRQRDIKFSIDGVAYTTCDREQRAVDLLNLAGLDPTLFDLGRLRGKKGGTRRYSDDEFVTIRPGSRFVSIRECATVA